VCWWSAALGFYIFLIRLWFFTKSLLDWQVDEELDELISRIKLQEGNTEFWKRRFLGERPKPINEQKSEPENIMDDADVSEDASKEVEDDEADDEAEAKAEAEPDQTETEKGIVDRVKDKEVEAKKPPQMIGIQLLKDLYQPTTSKRSRRRKAALPQVCKFCQLLTSFLLFTTSDVLVYAILVPNISRLFPLPGGSLAGTAGRVHIRDLWLSNLVDIMKVCGRGLSNIAS